jgi:hypothetical protein
MQPGAFAVVLNVPPAHALQTRSVVGVPSLVIQFPGLQTLMAAHGVAGSLSWSHVPAEQVAGGFVPPAQNCPATHAWHTAAEVEVPAAVCTVPAAQLP